MIDLEFDGDVAIAVLNAPPANTIALDWCTQFHQVIDAVEAHGGVRVLHIKSALKFFCAGADLKAVAAGFSGGDKGTADFVAALRQYQNLFQRIESLSCVTVAEIAGAALGGGLELALSCDVRIVADDAKLGLPEVGLGLLPAIGGTQRLTAICGQAVAKRLIFTGGVVRGGEAIGLGIAQWSFPAEELSSQTVNLVRRLAAMPQRALKSAKECIRASEVRQDIGFEIEVARSRDLFESEETRSAVMEFLNRKRAS